MFKEERKSPLFKWEDLGHVQEGRPNLGPHCSVLSYRLLQYSFRDIMITELGVEKTNEILIRAGKLAGKEFCRNMLDTTVDFNDFIAQLQHTLKKEKIGILRCEQADPVKMTFIITIAEDLDCSGLPPIGEVVCQYDEGFLAGVLEAYTGKPFVAEEIDCWASGGRICRFEVKASE